VLSDQQKRAIYDQYGEEGLKGQVPPPGAGGSSTFSNGSGPFSFNPRNAEDIFAEFFGSNHPFSMGGGFGGLGGGGPSRESRFSYGMFGGFGPAESVFGPPIMKVLRPDLVRLRPLKTNYLALSKSSTTVLPGR
jgi:DnaJ family protein B protein 4